MALVPGVAHEAEEQMLVLEVVVTTHVHDVKMLDQKLAKFDRLHPVFNVLLRDEPLHQIRGNEALFING